MVLRLLGLKLGNHPHGFEVGWSENWETTPMVLGVGWSEIGKPPPWF